MRQMTLKKGNFLILEDSRSTLDEFYIVETGQVVVDTKEPHFEQMVDSEDYYFEFETEQKELTPGCFFGLMSPILGFKRFESVWAIDDSNILCVHKNDIPSFIQQYKQYTRYILTELFERLKSYNLFFNSQDHPSQDQQILYEIANHFHQNEQLPQALYAYETLIRENPESTYASLARQQVAKEKKLKRYLRPTDFVKNQPKRYQKNNM